MLVLFLFFGVSQVIQTTFVGKKVSKELSRQVFSKLGLEIEFEKIEIGLFPPITNFKNVKLRSKINNPLRLDVQAASLGIQLSYLDVFSKNFRINKILIYDAGMELETPEELKNEGLKIEDIKHFDFKSFFEFYNAKIIKKIPIQIKELGLEQIDLNINKKKFFVDSLSIKITPKKIIGMGTIENENLVMFSALYPGEQEIDFDFEVSETGAKVRNIKFKNRQDFIGIKGDVKNINGNLNLVGDLEFFVKMETLEKAFPKFDKLKKMDGMIYGKSKISKDIIDPDLSFELAIFNFSSEYVDLDEIEVKGEKKGPSIIINALKGKEETAKIELKEAIRIADLNKIDLSNFYIALSVENFFTNKILKYVPALHPIKAYLNGDFKIQFDNGKLLFILNDKFFAKNFVLKFGEGSKPILKNEIVELGGLKVSVLKNDNVEVLGELRFKKSSLAIQGQVLNSEKTLEFNAKSGKEFSFTDFGPISGIELKGNGIFDLLVSGPTKDVKINFNGNIKGFGFLGFNFGDVIGKVEYSINKNTLKVNEINSVLNNSEIIGSGELVFGDNSNIDIHILTPHITYQDSLIIYEPLVKNVTWVKQKGDFEYLADYKVSGPMDLKKLSVKGYFKGGESFFLNEQVNSFEGKYSYQNQNIKISNLAIKDGKGNIFINTSYDLPTSNFEYKSDFEGVRLSDLEFLNFLNLGLDGEIVGVSNGTRKQGSLKTTSNINLLSTRIGGEEVQDSKIEIFTEDKKANLSGNLFGKNLDFKGYLDFSPTTKSKNSFLDFKIRADRLPLLTGIISSHNTLNPNLKGELLADISTSFDISRPQFLNLDFKVDSFNWSDGGQELGLKKYKDSIKINNGIIQKWDLEASGGGDYFKSIGTGNIYGNFQIKNDFSFDPRVIQLLSPNIQQISGRTSGTLVFNGKYPKWDTSFNIGTKLERLKIQFLPGLFEDFQINISQKESLLKIEKFKGKFGKGDVNLTGTIRNPGDNPSLNLNYELMNINFPFLKKSYANFSGKGSLQGDSRPYNLSGDFLLGYGEVRDTPKDLMEGQDSTVNYNKWLPKKDKFLEGSWLNLDLRMDLANRLAIKNKLADIRIGGDLAVQGDTKNKVISGNLSVIPNISYFNFKANKFVINDGLVELQNYPKETPYLRLSANSFINKYEVKVNANGKVNKLVFDLSSEPTLSREDILSLITLGFTSKDTVGLSEREKETMTSVGIGTLLADQLELSEGLTSDFGVSLSVTPELQEIEKSNQPETREGSVLPTQSKFKSATRIGFKKQITEKSEISFSNTIGGSIDQKQEVSSEYFINKNTSIKGTYEMFNSSNREVQDSGAQSNNLGVDLIFKWSFK